MNQPIISGYVIHELLGSGATAEVWHITDDAGADLAAKVFITSDPACGAIEWEALQRYRGPHVLGVHDWVLCEDGRRALICDLASGGSLYDVACGRGGLTSGECVTALAPIAEALAEIHDDGFVHGDLTPRNILFEASGKPLVADLGATRPVAEQSAPEWGSAGFIAPEILAGETPTSAADVYSLGACAWFALVGEPPEPPVLRPRLSDVVPDVTPALAQLITSALVVSPQARPTMAQVHDRLMNAAPSVVVPVSALPRGSETNDLMTVRLRAEAAQKQQSRAHTFRTHGRRVKRGHQESHTGRRVVLAGTAGLGITAVALGIPLHTVAPTQPVAFQSKSSPPIRTVHDVVAPPNESDIRRLMECRAHLWADPKHADIGACIAAGSPAFHGEEAALAQARRANLHYTGLTFTASAPASVQVNGHDAEVVLEVTRSSYQVGQGSNAKNVGEKHEHIVLSLTKVKDHWLMKSWKGA